MPDAAAPSTDAAPSPEVVASFREALVHLGDEAALDIAQN